MMRALSRKASETDRQELGKLLEASRNRFRSDLEAATQLINVGVPEPQPDERDPVDLAAWSVLANVILNLDEALTKG
jgi:hypothetical protein